MEPHILEIYSEVLNSLSESELSGDEFKGRLKITDDIKEKLILLQNSELTSGSYTYYKNNEKISDIILNCIIPSDFYENYEFLVDLSSSCFKRSHIICRNWDTLLSNELLIKQPATFFYLTEPGILYTPDSDETIYTNYQATHGVYKLIRDLSLSTEGVENTIFYERPLRFDFVLQEKDLSNHIDVDAINRLIHKDLHKEAISCLISKELVTFLKDINSRDRFGHLLRNIGSFTSNVLLSYQSYVENYTFDKVRKEYLEKRTEYISKVHENFDKIATKLLSLPAGIWFATTQIEKLPVEYITDIAFYKNTSVVITISLLVLLLITNMAGQFKVINTLKSEYSAIFNNLKTNFESESQEISNAKHEIDSEAAKVECKLWLSIIVSLCLSGLTILMYLAAFPK